MMSRSHAAFINGIETFDGTAFDATTWDSPLSLAGTVSQNDAFIIQGSQADPAASGRYNTATQTIQVGDYVSVEARIEEPVAQTSGSVSFAVNAALALTTKDDVFSGVTGPASVFLRDSLVIKVELRRNGGVPPQPLASIVGSVTSGGAGNGTAIVTNVPLIGVTYRFGIERLTSSSTRFSAEVVGGTAFPSVIRSHAAIDDLFLTLSGFNARITFDNVRVIPEPTVGSLTAAALCLFVVRRHTYC